MFLKRKMAFFMLLNLSFINLLNAESLNPIEANYILRSTSEKWIYNIYLKNYSNFLSDLKLTFDDIEPNYSKKLLSNNKLEFSNFYKNSWKIVVEKFVTTYESGVTNTFSDSKTKEIEIRNLDDTYFLWNHLNENISWKILYVIPISSNIDYINFSNKTYELDINWTIFPLEYDVWNYEDWKYYISKWQIRFLSKNIDSPLLNIKLKIDKLYSNSISINRETIKLDKINSIDVSENYSNRELRIHISKDNNLSYISDKDLYINWVLVDKNNITIYWSELIVKVDISKKIEDVLVLQLKNNTDNTYSNKLYVDLKPYTVPNIKALDFWKNYLEYQNFDFKMIWSWLFWDLYNFEINLNWTWYTKEWIKDFIKNSDWNIETDLDWNQRYNIVQKLDLKRAWDYLYFESFLKNLQDTNTLYITNKNYEKTSNIVYFSKDLKTINYNSWETNNKKETLTYTKWDNISKNIDFLQKPEGDFKLWKITLNNFKENDYYRVSFNIKTDSSINPLTSIKLWDEILETNKINNQTIFSYKKAWYWKDFSEKELIFNLNQLFNSNKINLKITDINIEKLNSNSELKNIYNDNIDKEMSLSYKYNISDCFDWAGDFCDALKLWWDSFLNLNLTFWNVINKQLEEVKQSTNTANTVNQINKTDENITAEDKSKYKKQLVISQINLNKNTKLKKYISKIDKFVNSLNDTNSKKIIQKISKMDKTKLWKNIDIINYIEAKIMLKWSK